MRLIGPGEEITPAAIVEGALLWFTVPSGDHEQRVFLRIPTTEQIDEARYIERVTRRSYKARAEMEHLATLPVSPLKQAQYKREIADWQRRFDEQEDGSTLKDEAADMLTFLQETLDHLTLADEECDRMASLARDRYLCFACLADEHGSRRFAGKLEDSTAWEAIPMRVKDAARVPLQRVLEALVLLPFE